jgi:hypothetical protein
MEWVSRLGGDHSLADRLGFLRNRSEEVCCRRVEALGVIKVLVRRQGRKEGYCVHLYARAASLAHNNEVYCGISMSMCFFFLCARLW